MRINEQQLEYELFSLFTPPHPGKIQKETFLLGVSICCISTTIAGERVSESLKGYLPTSYIRDVLS